MAPPNLDDDDDDDDDYDDDFCSCCWCLRCRCGCWLSLVGWWLLVFVGGLLVGCWLVLVVVGGCVCLALQQNSPEPQLSAESAAWLSIRRYLKALIQATLGLRPRLASRPDYCSRQWPVAIPIRSSVQTASGRMIELGGHGSMRPLTGCTMLH